MNWLCGCGAPFRQCDFWSDVIEAAFGDLGSLDLDRVRSSERELLRLRNSALWLTPVPRRKWFLERHQLYFDSVDRLYRAITEVSGAAVIIDNSKTPSYGAVLATLPTVDLRVLHLVRDPRATAYSWLNPKTSPDRGEGQTMDRLGLKKSAFLWLWWNGLSEAIWAGRKDVPITRIRYEAFAADPGPVIRQVQTLLAPELTEPIHVKGARAYVSRSHTVSGNPIRMGHGRIHIEPDDRWRAGLARRDQRTVQVLTRPLMKRYGYLT